MFKVLLVLAAVCASSVECSYLPSKLFYNIFSVIYIFSGKCMTIECSNGIVL